jgi:hypothetical protein
MHLFLIIRNNANNNLLLSILTLGLRLYTQAEIANILYNTMHYSYKIDFILVIYSNADKKLSLTRIANILL